MVAEFIPVIGENPTVLLSTMAVDVASHKNPWSRHWFILPGSGRAEWVQQLWAQLSGIASRSEILPVRSLVEKAANGSGYHFDRNALTLAIVDSLNDIRNHLPRHFGEDSTITGGRLAWARQLADALDVAYLCRQPEARFTCNDFLEPLSRCSPVAAQLSKHLGSHGDVSYAKAAGDWISALQQRGGLPHIWLQLDLGLPTMLMERLLQLLRLLPADHVHCYVLAPSHQYWQDLRVGRRRVDDESERDPGPILRSCGRRAQDLQAQLINGLLEEGSGERELVSPDTSTGLLSRLQASCRDLSTEFLTGPHVADDPSFSVHACRSPLRELEIVRDQILRAMAEDPDLEPHQVQILLADSATYAPLVMAACNPQHDPSLHLPLRLYSSMGDRRSLCADAIRCLLKSFNGRFEQEDLLALLENEVIAAHFHLSTQAEEIVSWLQDAQFRWGINHSHREQIQGADYPMGDFRFALRRLALGATATPRSIGERVLDMVPLQRTAGIGVSRLADLAQLAAAIEGHASNWQALAQARPLNEWIDHLATLCQDFFGIDREECPEGLNPLNWAQVTKQHKELFDALTAYLDQKLLDATPLSSDGFRRLVQPLLDTMDQELMGGGSGITVANLVDWAGTPAKVTAVVGLSADSFPASEERPNWHPLSGQRQWGDPDRREDDRHALLLALLAAEDRLILSYQGGSEHDAQERPPATTLAELLLACQELTGEPAERFIQQHSLNAFSPHDNPAQRSWVAEDVLASRLLTSAKSTQGQGLWQTALPEEHSDRISMASLQKIVKEPCAIFLRRLGIFKSDEAEEFDSSDILQSSGLNAWKQRERLLDNRLQQADGQDDDALYRTYLAESGQLPPGRYGDATWEKIAQETPAIQFDSLTAIPDPGPMHLAAADGNWILEGSTALPWYRDEAGSCHCFSVSSATKASLKRATTQLPLLIDLLRMADADGRISSATFHFAKGISTTLQAPHPEDRPALWASLHRLYQLARRVPLPWWPKTHEVWVKHHEYGNPISEMDLSFHKLSHFGETLSHQFATDLAFRGLDDIFTWNGPKIPGFESTTDALGMDSDSLAIGLCEFINGWWMSANPSEGEA